MTEHVISKLLERSTLEKNEFISYQTEELYYSDEIKKRVTDVLLNQKRKYQYLFR